MQTADPRVRRAAAWARRALLPVLVTWAAGASPTALPPVDAPPALASAPVAAGGASVRVAYEGVVEAQRQTVVASSVPGAVVALAVRAGDTVQAGQVLLRIDARAADQSAAAGAAQARAAQAALEESTRDAERQQQLFAQGFISQAAFDRVQAHLRTVQAETSARLANAGAARSQSELSVIRAPYAGVVAQVAVVLGDMALPGRPLLTLYDPGALRVSAAIPTTAARSAPLEAQVEVPGAIDGRIAPARVQLLPTVDPASHTLELRADLPAGTRAVPGLFARVWLDAGAAGSDAAATRFFVPAQALLRRSEVAAVYVIGADGRPRLRQVRPGRGEGERVEILSGLAPGERVALDPQAAARLH